MAESSEPRRRSQWMNGLYSNLLIIILILLVPQLKVISAVGDSETEGLQGIEETSTQPTIVETYDCPSLCSCHYDPQHQHLKISCHKSTPSSTTSHHRQVSLSHGLQRLGLNHLSLSYLTTRNGLMLPGNMDNLLELSLHDISLDPVLFITSQLFQKSRQSLQKLRITNVELRSTVPISDPQGPIITSSHLAQLQSLQSLILSNSPATFSTLLLSALPKLNSLTMFNASLTHLDPLAFSHLANTLQTLNLSTNGIRRIPWGFLSQFPNLHSLDLSSNHLQHLQEEVFVGLKTLRKLNVSHNQIEYVDADVFTPLTSLHTLDLSQNELIQIFEPYFVDNAELRTLLLHRTWAVDSFLNTETGIRSMTEMDKLLETLQRVETLDLRDNDMRIIPESLTHLPHLKTIYLMGNPWACSCSDQWVDEWLSSFQVTFDNATKTGPLCAGKTSLHLYLQQLNCSNTNLIARTPRKYYGLQGKSKTLKCHTQRQEGPRVLWTLPRSGQVLHSTRNAEFIDSSYHRVLRNGDLFISNLTAEAYGLYVCVAEYPTLNITHFIHLGVDTSIFLDVKLASIVIGWLTSFGFLMTVLTIQLIRFILTKNGIDCPSITAPYKARRIKIFFENMEQHKNSQLEWLRDNYNQQVKRVKDNCVSQVERIRESYTVQTKNLSDIRDYGAQQIQTVRDQYHDQIRRVSSYSTQQLCKARENYVFQRNRVGKFSSHQLLRLRETYKWQAQTVNKILENLPKTLNFDTCRGVGACGRTDSIYMDEMSEVGENGLLLDASQLEAQMFFLPMESLFHEPIRKPEHVSVFIPSEEVVFSSDEVSLPMGDTIAQPTVEEDQDRIQSVHSLSDHDNITEV